MNILANLIFAIFHLVPNYVYVCNNHTCYGGKYHLSVLLSNDYYNNY